MTENDLAPVRFVGDVHGKQKQLVELSKGAKHTICLGDVGFDYTVLNENADPTQLRCLGGNHEAYNKLSPHFLGDYGVHKVPEFGDIFFVRGGYSIDWRNRRDGLTWFKEEELSYAESMKAIEEYKKIKPAFVISHECPNQIKDRIPFRRLEGYGEVPVSKTSRMLDEMFDAHKPNRWLFGHYHVNWSEVIDWTFFTCLAELQYTDFFCYPG